MQRARPCIRSAVVYTKVFRFDMPKLSGTNQSGLQLACMIQHRHDQI